MVAAKTPDAAGPRISGSGISGSGISGSGTAISGPDAAAQAHLAQAGAGAARHVAIIMDGNGRWATNRGWPRLVGHRRGAERVREIVRAAPDMGLRWLTLYAFSTENWKRSTEEVLGLMGIFAHFIQREAAALAREGVRLRFIGDRSRLAPKLQRLMAGIEAKTAHLTRLNLIVAINYGGRDEILRAARRIATEAAEGRFNPADLTDAAFSHALDTGDVPDPDLVIRTSGETRTSNFLVWQAAYSEYEFTETLWPDFTPDELASILSRFGNRERRFGGAKP
ncbi:polyprenyl diphosphate synthase [Gemmobacter sp. 24YEA27]|uniref:polyprenyl diphosphate synthase n=1 Tax=Gemmobacter sp. 24YEA27 TaxID=3040672 RepID=UPI0024B33C71|nr:polyprenyl diphosphate synthase [Gemmobacter sp. 24YEA27]